MEDQHFPEQKAWYKTGGGVVFLGILAVLLLILIIFGGFVTYYVYQIRAGHGADIARQFQEEQHFSTLTEADNAAETPGQDPTPFIRQHNPQFGNAESPVKIIAFIDFECPYCREAFPTFEHIREQYGSGVHIVLKHFPLASIHPLATRAGLAASCADEQDSFWPYYNQLFAMRTLSRDALVEHAATIGLNIDTFTACLDSERYQQFLTQDIQDGFDLGVRGTPTYFVGSKKLEGVVPLTVWNDEIIRAIQSS